MKLRHLVAIIVVIAAVASCTQKKATLSEQLTGNWSGTDTIELTMVDSTGNTVIQKFSAPIEIEYLADSTFTAIITISETNLVKMGGTATFTDSTALISGSLSCQKVMDITGEMSINEDKSMKFTYIAEDTTEGLTHRGTVVVIRIKE